MNRRQKREGLDDTDRRVLEALRSGGQLIQVRGFHNMYAARVVPVGSDRPWEVPIGKVRRLVRSGHLRTREPTASCLRWGLRG